MALYSLRVSSRDSFETCRSGILSALGGRPLSQDSVIGHTTMRRVCSAAFLIPKLVHLYKEVPLQYEPRVMPHVPDLYTKLEGQVRKASK